MAKLSNNRKKRTDALSQAILMRLELLNEEKPDLAMVQGLGMRDRNYLREQFQAVEGGVDTTLEFVCPTCSHEWNKDLDLSTAGFFFPGAVQKP